LHSRGLGLGLDALSVAQRADGCGRRLEGPLQRRRRGASDLIGRLELPLLLLLGQNDAEQRRQLPLEPV
jgi:hypothetical protein